MISTMKISVFSGHFADDETARAFCDWDDALDKNDPLCMLAETLNCDGLDVDFVESVFGDEERFDYVKRLLLHPEDIVMIKAMSPSTDNTLIVIFEYGENKSFQWQPVFGKLTFCGQYDGQFLP